MPTCSRRTSRATARPRSTAASRAARKEIFGLGFHPKGFGHPHIFSDIDAFTIGAVQDLPFDRLGRVGVGADITIVSHVGRHGRLLRRLTIVSCVPPMASDVRRRWRHVH